VVTIILQFPHLQSALYIHLCVGVSVRRPGPNPIEDEAVVLEALRQAAGVAAPTRSSFGEPIPRRIRAFPLARVPVVGPWPGKRSSKCTERPTTPMQLATHFSPADKFGKKPRESD